MILRLFQPHSMNWLLLAEQLNDPPTWDRFLPVQLPNSDRSKFESAVNELANGRLKLSICKTLLKRGLCLFEYDWNASEEDILVHAILVADKLGVELLMGDPDRPGVPAA